MAISGFIREMGESDDCLNRLCTEAGILSGVSDQHGVPSVRMRVRGKDGSYIFCRLTQRRVDTAT